MNLIDQLEEYRKARKLSKTDMAKEFAVRYQNYHNWTARGSLPKEYYQKALQILGMEHLAEAIAEEHPDYPADIKEQLTSEAQDLSSDELVLLQDFSEFLLWRRTQR